MEVDLQEMRGGLCRVVGRDGISKIVADRMVK